MLATEGVKAYVTAHGEEMVALAKVYDFDVALLYRGRVAHFYGAILISRISQASTADQRR
jgi:hypothetical protein